MKNLKKLMFGIVLLAVGIVVLLNALDVTDIDIFFPVKKGQGDIWYTAQAKIHTHTHTHYTYFF